MLIIIIRNFHGSQACRINSGSLNQIELKFRNVGFSGGKGKPGYSEKTPRSKARTPKNATHIWLLAGIEPRPHWWKASANHPWSLCFLARAFLKIHLLLPVYMYSLYSGGSRPSAKEGACLTMNVEFCEDNSGTKKMRYFQKKEYQVITKERHEN